MAFSADTPSERSLFRSVVLLVRAILKRQAVRFLLVGGLNTLFGYALFTAFYLVSHARQPSLVASTVISVVFNFFTTGRLVFANRSVGRLLPFVAVYTVVLGLNMALLEILARSGAPTLLAQAIAMPLMVVVAYLLNRFVVFARRRGAADAPSETTE